MRWLPSKLLQLLVGSVTFGDGMELCESDSSLRRYPIDHSIISGKTTFQTRLTHNRAHLASSQLSITIPGCLSIIVMVSKHREHAACCQRWLGTNCCGGTWDE